MNARRIRHTFAALALTALSLSVNAQSGSNRLSFGVGWLYPSGLDATISLEHETKSHNAWEYFINGYLKYKTDESVGHITQDSFWKNYNTWGAGIAYKPCVYRGKNSYGSLRLGASGVSDTEKFIGFVNVGYEHNYALRQGWQLYWQVKGDLCLNAQDLFRTGVVLGVKLPITSR